jgi:hypothetical protein
MALGNTNISITAVGTEISSASKTISGLVGAAGLNKYSFYGPGALSVDANKDVVLTPPASVFKLGDYRSYNHLSETPHPQADYTLYWGPGGVTTTATIPWFPNAMNIMEFAYPGTYVTYKFYDTALGRSGEVGDNLIYTFTSAIDFATITPLAGHTRGTTQRANSMQLVVVTNLPTTTATLYMDTYISDMSGNRLINLGTKANGYTTITLLEQSAPYVYGANSNIPTKPEHYTMLIPNVYSTNRCTEHKVDQSLGTSYSFNVVAYGLYNDGEGVNEYRTVRLPVCHAKINVDGYDTVLTPVPDGVELPDTGLSFTGTLSAGTFNNGDVCAVTFTAGTTVDPTDFVSCSA